MASADKSKFQFQDRPVDQGREIRALIIGAGVSGIGTYIRLKQYVPNIKITIVEKNPSVGGTWYVFIPSDSTRSYHCNAIILGEPMLTSVKKRYENRYPGVACDIPSAVYQYTFEPNTQWSKYFSPGAEIQDYVKGVARKYGVSENVHYNSKVTGATWDQDVGVWNVELETSSADGVKSRQSLETEVVISATGLLNKWKWPSIAGLDKFQGKLLHSADWDSSW